MSTEAMNHSTEREPDHETLFHLPEVEPADFDSEISLTSCWPTVWRR